jgi:hypothetical protein
MPLALTNALWEVAYAYHAEAEEDLTDSGRVVSKPEVIQMAPRGSVTISLRAVSEAPTSEDLRIQSIVCGRFRYSDLKEAAPPSRIVYGVCMWSSG